MKNIINKIKNIINNWLGVQETLRKYIDEIHRVTHSYIYDYKMANNQEIENLKKEIENLKIEIMNNHANHIELKYAYNKYLSEYALKDDYDLELFYKYEHITIEDVKPMYKDYTNKYHLNSLIDEVELTNLNEDKNND